MKQKENVHECHEDDFLREGMLERLDRSIDEFAPVVERGDRYAGGQARCHGGEAGFDGCNHAIGIFTVAHDHDTTDNLATVYIEGAAAKITADLDGRYIPEVERLVAAR